MTDFLLTAELAATVALFVVVLRLTWTAGRRSGHAESVTAALTEAEQRRVATEQAARETAATPTDMPSWLRPTPPAASAEDLRRAAEQASRRIAQQGVSRRSAPQPERVGRPTALVWPQFADLPDKRLVSTPGIPAAVPVRKGRHHATTGALHAVTPSTKEGSTP